MNFLRTLVRRQTKFHFFTYRLLSRIGLLGPTKYLLQKALGHETFTSGKVSVLAQGEMPLVEWEQRHALGKRIKEIQTIHFLGDPLAEVRPKISVLISLYQSDSFIQSFVDNMLNQTARNLSEFVVIAVQPSDLEKEHINRLTRASRFSSLTVIDHRIGIYEAWNLAVEHSSADLLTNANADDRRSRHSLANQIDFMEKHSWIDGAYSDVYLTTRHDCGFERARYIGARTHFPEYVDLNQLLLRGLNYMHNGPVWRKSLHTHHGKFDESFTSAGDFDFWIRCSVKGSVFMKMESPHLTYFLNPDGLSTRKDTPGQVEVEEINSRELKSLDKLARSFSLPPTHTGSHQQLDQLNRLLEGQR